MVSPHDQSYTANYLLEGNTSCSMSIIMIDNAGDDDTQTHVYCYSFIRSSLAFICLFIQYSMYSSVDAIAYTFVMQLSTSASILPFVHAFIQQITHEFLWCARH